MFNFRTDARVRNFFTRKFLKRKFLDTKIFGFTVYIRIILKPQPPASPCGEKLLLPAQVGVAKWLLSAQLHSLTSFFEDYGSVCYGSVATTTHITLKTFDPWAKSTSAPMLYSEVHCPHNHTSMFQPLTDHPKPKKQRLPRLVVNLCCLDGENCTIIRMDGPVISYARRLIRLYLRNLTKL